MSVTISPTSIANKLTKISPVSTASLRAAANTMSATLDSEANKRVEQIKRFRDYFNGHQISNVGDDGESLPYINLCYKVVEKQVTWLVGKPPELKARDDIHPIVEELYDEIISNSGKEEIFTTIVQEGSITGDVFIHVAYDPDVNYGEGGFGLKVIPSERAFPEYRNTGNLRKLSKILICWDQLNDIGEVETVYELWDDEYVLVSTESLPQSLVGIPKDVSFELVDGPDNKTYRRYKNPYGEIPFVHIPNILLTDSVFGRSDLHDLWILNREMNEQLLSYKDNVEYHGNPITLLFGVSSKDIERGANKVWGNLPLDSEVKNLEVTQTHEAILKYFDLLREFVGLVGVPYSLLGNTTDPSTLRDTSGVSMKLSFLPIIEVIEKKRVTYGKGICEAIEMALRITARFYDLDFSELDGMDERTRKKIEGDTRLSDSAKQKLIEIRSVPWWKTDIIWHDHLPKSRQAELTDIALELQHKLESIPGALRRLGVKDVELKMEEISETQELLAVFSAMESTVAGDFAVEEGMADETAEDLTPSDEGIDGNVDDNAGGAGRTARPEPVNSVEDRTGQSAERTAEQRASGTGLSD